MQLLISADTKKALVCSINSNSSSSLQILYGDPDDYAYKLGNDTFEHDLPILQTRMYFDYHDYFHSISIDYRVGRVYYSNHVLERLEYSPFVQHGRHTFFYQDVPITNQVNKRSLLGFDLRILFGS